MERFSNIGVELNECLKGCGENFSFEYPRIPGNQGRLFLGGLFRAAEAIGGAISKAAEGSQKGRASWDQAVADATEHYGRPPNMDDPHEKFAVEQREAQLHQRRMWVEEMQKTGGDGRAMMDTESRYLQLGTGRGNAYQYALNEAVQLKMLGRGGGLSDSERTGMVLVELRDNPGYRSQARRAMGEHGGFSKKDVIDALSALPAEGFGGCDIKGR